jgi:pre-mRNA-splicing factor ISY1
MLARFLKVQQGKSNTKKERRPIFASDVQDINEATKWRQQVIREVAKNVSIIQDASIGEHKIRDLNDLINKLMREKRHWERQIKALGGPDYMSSGQRVVDANGSMAISADGYYYFGAARELPGVQDLLEQKNGMVVDL